MFNVTLFVPNFTLKLLTKIILKNLCSCGVSFSQFLTLTVQMSRSSSTFGFDSFKHIIEPLMERRWAFIKSRCGLFPFLCVTKKSFCEFSLSASSFWVWTPHIIIFLLPLLSLPSSLRHSAGGGRVGHDAGTDTWPFAGSGLPAFPGPAGGHLSHHDHRWTEAGRLSPAWHHAVPAAFPWEVGEEAIGHQDRGEEDEKREEKRKCRSGKECCVKNGI